MEKDDEVAGAGNSYTAQFWQYDSRLGRRWNLDPITFPFLSPYSTFADNPIYFLDSDGLSPQRGWFGRLFTSKRYRPNLRKGGAPPKRIKGGRRSKPKKKDPVDEKEEPIKDFGILVSFSNVKARIGANDNSPIATLARKFNMQDREFKVGHTGLIMVNSGTGETTYTDFGRFSGAEFGNGITRLGTDAFGTIDADVKNGILMNPQEIVESLLSNDYFMNNSILGKNQVWYCCRA